MSQRSDVPPSTVAVDVSEDAVAVEYLDGRRVRYPGPPTTVEAAVRCQPGKEVHVLVTDESGTEGVLVYVNDRTTSDEILEGSGVGRVFLASGESTELFPDVEASVDGHAVTVSAGGAVSGRVFVFEEDELGERAFEVVAEA